MRVFKKVLISALIIAIIYQIGPQPRTPVYSASIPTMPSVENIESYITSKELKHRLKPDNQARIVWYNDSVHAVTEYAIVYLHGFSASQEEGDPVHRNVARKFGMNLYLSRLSQHGIDTSEQLLNLNAENYWASAKEALAVGKSIGKKVILMGTSTGASQALQLAAYFPKDVAAIFLYSPNIEINDRNAWLLNNPWGLQIARLVKGGKNNVPPDSRPIYKQYWNTPYRLESVVALQEMLESSMTEETFKKVHQPCLMLYYYKDEDHQDEVVKVSAMKSMFERLGTPDNLKRSLPLPNTGNHVIASPIKSADVASVEKETERFLEDILPFIKSN